MDIEGYWFRYYRTISKIYVLFCLRNNDYQGSQFVLVTGPNWELSKKLNN